MTDDAKFKKEIQNHKKEHQEKKVELISRLCAEEITKKDRKKQRIKAHR